MDDSNFPNRQSVYFTKDGGATATGTITKLTWETAPYQNEGYQQVLHHCRRYGNVIDATFDWQQGTTTLICRDALSFGLVDSLKMVRRPRNP